MGKREQMTQKDRHIKNQKTEEKKSIQRVFPHLRLLTRVRAPKKVLPRASPSFWLESS